MNRTIALSLSLALVLVVAVAYAASVFWIGRMVEQEVGTWSQTLTARDDVLVTRFDYDRGFGSGTLRYDLTWRPPETDAWHELLDEMGLLSERGFRLSGNLPVKHGPWVDGGFALAGSEVSLPLPDDLRSTLPQYPGQEPLVKTDVVLTFGGEARATARVIDYRGRVQGPDMHAPGDLELAGLWGSIRASDALDRVALELTLDRVALRIPAEGLAMALSGLEITAYAEESLPRVWLGPLAFRIHELALEAEGSRLEMSGLSLEGDSGVIDGKLRSSGRMVVGPSRLDDHGILGADFEMVLEGIDAAAYADIMQVLEAPYAGTGTDADDEKLLEAFGRILAGGPRLAITRAHLALVAQDDFVASLSLALQDPPRFELEALEELLRSVVIDMEARVRIDALRNGMRSYVARDADDSVGREVVNARSEVMLVELLEQLREVPALAISGEDIQASLSLREGRLAVGGQDLIDVVDLGLMAAAGFFEGDKSSMADLGREETAWAERDIESLSRDFEALTAGRQLYLKHCSACHEFDARGSIGVPNLADGVWQWGGTPVDIKHTLLNGRQANMPGFEQLLGDEGVSNVAQYVLQLSGQYGADSAMAEQGQPQYMMFCSGCHGADGKGIGMLGAPNLTENVWMYGGSVGAIETTIRQGRAGVMPAFGELLGEDRVHVLSAYVYSLGEAERVRREAMADRTRLEAQRRDAEALQRASEEGRRAAEAQRRNAQIHAYIAEVQATVDRRWKKPEGTRATDEAVVLVRINPDTGHVLSFDVQRCAGSAGFCESVRQTMERLQSLPRPPDMAAVRGGIPIRFSAEHGAGTQVPPSAKDSPIAAQGGNAQEQYSRKLQDWLERYKDYPRLAQQEGKEGTAVLAFTFNRLGMVLDHAIVQSSGHAILDNAVVQMIRRAQPLPGIPPEITVDQFEVIVPIEFRLDRATTEPAAPLVTDILPGSAGPFVVGQPFGAEALPEGYQIVWQEETVVFEGDEYLETRLSLRHHDHDEMVATALEGNGELVVAEIRVLNERFSTSEGFRVGTPLSEILRRHPESEVGYSYLIGDFILVDAGHPGLQDVFFMVDLDDFNGDPRLLDCHSDFCPLSVDSFRPDTLIREIRIR